MKEATWTWSPEQAKLFQKIKDRYCVLGHYSLYLENIATTDASTQNSAAILENARTFKGVLKPIASGNIFQPVAAKKYVINELDLLASVLAFNIFAYNFTVNWSN